VVGFVVVVVVVGCVDVVVVVVGCVVVVVLEVGGLKPPTAGMEEPETGVVAEGLPPVSEMAMAPPGTSTATRAITATTTAKIDRGCRTFCRQSKPCR